MPFTGHLIQRCHYCKLLVLSAVLLSSCNGRREHRPSIIFGSGLERPDTADTYDLPQILSAGTLIGVTMSGPDTYYEYRGQGFGLQFQMAEEFARMTGVSLQMEIAPDSASMMKRLETGEVDFICMETEKDKPWPTRHNTPLLTEALRKWWNPRRARRLAGQARKTQAVKRHGRPVMQDRRRGVISPYDDLFIRHSATAGWDWRLLAAQCYQESGFDPKAVSWAGAQGLMQLMPATAAHLGINGSQVFDPESNIAGAARYISQLNATFSDIADPQDRTAFVLAAYNGGAHHVRDAMTLTRKNGGNEKDWQQVAAYILHLSEPTYYRDPDVKHGYMRGSETEGYVRLILQRWADYRGSARAATAGSKPAPARRSVKDGTFQSQVRRPDTIPLP